jgi:cytoplasmic iron level regulating protein YaaA (DUF328/UPF0246 family)
MLFVISPAKTLDYQTPPTTDQYTIPEFIPRAAELIDILRRYAPAQIGTLMGISDSLAALNAARYATWSEQFTTENAKQAILAFNGDVYEGLDAASLNATQLTYAQSHLRILSGLYGLLRPLDLMQPYRLEMGTRLDNSRGRNLYAFWGDTLTQALNSIVAAAGTRALINLASDEYFKAVRPKLLSVPVITPVFEDWKNGKYKIISFYAKRARGLMARYAAVNGIVDPEQLRRFDGEGYALDESASSAQVWVYRRRLED